MNRITFKQTPLISQITIHNKPSLLQPTDTEDDTVIDRLKITDNQSGMALKPQEINLLRLIGIQQVTAEQKL